MMHELSLCGQVPLSRHTQILNVLAGLAAMQPQRILERHIIYKPIREPVRFAPQVGASQAVHNAQKQALQNQLSKDLFYMHLVQTVSERDFGRTDGSAATVGSWRMQFSDVPEAGKKSATLRLISSVDIVEGDADAHMRALGYK
jgi:mediator of RNA polymerase II transcription subunit 18, fungi type